MTGSRFSRGRLLLAGLLAGLGALSVAVYLAQDRPLLEFVRQHPWAALGTVGLLMLPAVLYEAAVTGRGR